MSLYKKLTLLFLILCLFAESVTHPTNVVARELHLDKYKFFVYIIYDNDATNSIKLLYEEDRFGKINSELNREITQVRMILSPGTYITSVDYAYNAYQFKLESTATEKGRSFYFDLKEGKHYFLARLTTDGMPSIVSIDELKAKEMLKSFKKVE